MEMGLRKSPLLNFFKGMLMSRLSRVCWVKGNETAPAVDVTTKAWLLSTDNLLYCPEGKNQVLIAASTITSIIKVSALGKLLGFLMFIVRFWQIEIYFSSCFYLGCPWSNIL